MTGSGIRDQGSGISVQEAGRRYVEMPVFSFGEYTLRPSGPADLPLARAWNAADPDHAWELGDALYWIRQSETLNSFLLNDAQGPVFFFQGRIVPSGRTEAIEVSIQFDRTGHTPIWRTTCAIAAGWVWLEKRLSSLGYEAVYFNSKTPRLIQFAVRRLKFGKIENLDLNSAALGYERFEKMLKLRHDQEGK